MCTTHLFEKDSGVPRQGKHHDHAHVGDVDVVQDDLDLGVRVGVHRDAALVRDADGGVLRQAGELLQALPPVLVVTAHQGHPVPFEPLQQVHDGHRLQLVVGHGAHERRVQPLVTELGAGGGVANLTTYKKTFFDFYFCNLVRTIPSPGIVSSRRETTT